MESAKVKLTRPPVVAVLGHVDHGKTTLLDALRATNVQAKEAGGITQRIGASVIRTKDGSEVVFIDTPGHQAFSKMRSCGVSAADLALLVIAADDGVKPQTKESLAYIKEAGIPFIVVFTKMDLPTARVEAVKKELSEEGVFLEGSGGEVPFVCVSAKTKTGLDNLLELILLFSELNGIGSNSDKSLKAVVIETAKTKAGLTVSAIVKEGILRERQTIYAGALSAKVRGIKDVSGKNVEEILPGYPALILGFEKLPPVGSLLTDQLSSGKALGFSSIESSATEEKGEINLVLKAESQCALEAVLGGIPPQVKIIAMGIGEVTKNDVLEAKNFGALIFTFGVKVSSEVRKLAESETVKIEEFEIIYRLFERLTELIQNSRKKILARAEVVAEFPFEDKRVAGCRLLEGEISLKDKLVLLRKEKTLGEARVISLRKGKQVLEKVKGGEEFGVIFAPQLDFKVGDMLLLEADSSAPHNNGN